MTSSQHSRSATLTDPFSEDIVPIDERRFKEAFYKLCKHYREHRSETSLSRLLNDYCENIIALTDEIDDASGQETGTCSERFFTSLLNVIEAGLGVGLRLDSVIELFRDHDIPDLLDGLDTDTRYYLRLANVRAPLELVFNEILECHASMRVHFREQQTSRAFNIEPVTTRWDEAASRIEGFTKEWANNLDAAKKAEAERTRRTSTSRASMANNLNGTPFTSPTYQMLFEYVRGLGRGRYASVSMVKEPVWGELLARKVIQCKLVDFERTKDEIKKEVDCMRNLFHHHIPQIRFGPLADIQKLEISILISPVGDCDLNDFLQDSNFTKKYDIWFGCLVSALDHAHASGIIHQDIKPTNIIIKNEQPYLTDFGSARDFSLQGSSISDDDRIRGTPNYLAPEEEPRQPRNRKADIFSLGCVFAEMFTVRQGQKRDDFYHKRLSVGTDPHFPAAYRNNLPLVKEWLRDLDCTAMESEDIRDSVIEMLDVRPDKRPRSSTLLKQFRVARMVCRRCDKRQD